MAAIASLIVTEASARPVSSYAPVGAETSVPYGWVDFCQRYSGECQESGRAAQDIPLTATTLNKISRVNRWVNRNIAPVSDKDHVGVVEQWDYPHDSKGDCEDFALLKRRMLIQEGFPAGALLMTVVKDQNGDGHSVLTIKTTRGDYVLDNLSDAVFAWTQLPYRFVKRQSQQDPNVWVAIGAPTSAPAYVSNK